MPWFTPEVATLDPIDAAHVRQHAIVPSPAQERIIKSEATIVVAVSVFGQGKCLKIDTPVIMADGTIKPVQDIEVGDEVMGDDSRPRTVLSLGRGREEMFEVIPFKSEPFTVNRSHILSLKRNRNDAGRGEPPGTIIDVSVDEYLQKPRWWKARWCLYHVAVEFPFRPVTVPPYLLGLWLGDGTTRETAITTPDAEIVEYLEKIAAVLDVDLNRRASTSGGKSWTYAFRGKTHRTNWLQMAMRDYGLLSRNPALQDKFIPYAYKCNSREIRLELLAGLIDSGGSPNKSGYEITQKRKALADDIAYLARSLGFQVSMRATRGVIKALGFEGDYWRLHINGDCSIIPVKISRKKVPPRRQSKDILLSGIRAVVSHGVDDYYGFTLDGNHRYLLGDFTVTHNTFACIMGMIYHAYRHGVKLRACIIRDTHTNILRTIVPAFDAFFLESGTPHKWSHDFKKLQIYVAQGIDVDLLGIDDLASVADIQGGEWGLIWLEEPCPYTDSRTANAGLSEDLYNAALVRCTRQKGTKGRLQISSNHPDEEHWFYKRCLVAPDGMVDPRTPLITKETIEIPPGENIHLKAESSQAVIAAYANDPIGYARFVKGEAAMRYPGKAVVGRLFNPAIHVSPIALEPVEGLMSWIGWDSWGNPAAVLGQQWPDGRLWILDECTDGEDVRDLLHNSVNPLVRSPRWEGKSYGWRQIGDRTMRQPDQSRHSESAADAVEKEFDPGMGQVVPFELGPQTWPQILLGVQHALQWMVRGQPAILIDPVRAKRLIGALKGRWHFAINRQGRPTSLTPEKDDASHCADAWANAVCVLSPWTSLMQQHYLKRRHFPQQRRRQIAASYVTRR